MKKALGLAEILIAAVVIIVVYFTCFAGNKYGRTNPFDDGQKIKSQQEIVDEKVQQIEDSKALKQLIENNLKEGY